MNGRQLVLLAVLMGNTALNAQEAKNPNAVPSQCIAGVDLEVSLAAYKDPAQPDLTKALIQAADCIARHPGVAGAWSKRAQLHSQLRDWDAAIADFTKALSLDPQDATIYVERAWVYGAKENYPAAFADYDKAIALQKNSTDAFVGRGDLHRSRGDRAKAAADYNAAIEAAKTDILGDIVVSGAYLGRGLLLMGDEKWAAAERELSLSLDRAYGSRVQALEARALVYEFMNQGDKALADYKELLEINPSSTRALERRADLLLKLGKRGEATADYKALQQIDPGHEAARTALATLDPKSGQDFVKVAREYANAEKWTEAIAAYDKAIVSDANLAEAWSGRAAAYSRMGDSARAVADYTKAIALDPKEFNAYNGRAHTHQALGDSAKALADFSHVISTATEPMALVSAYLGRADLHIATQRADSARADFDKAIEVGAKDSMVNYVFTPDAYLGRARLSLAAGNKDAARADLKKALELNPKHSTVKDELLKLDPAEPKTAEEFLKVALEAGKKNDAKGAIDALNRCIAIDAKSIPCHGYLARALVATRDLPAATTTMTKLIELNPKDPASYAGRGMVYAMQNKRMEAIRDFRMALDLKPDFAEAKQALERLEGAK
jgi:tetratricopeptide (TPR) repeat protein